MCDGVFSCGVSAQEPLCQFADGLDDGTELGLFRLKVMVIRVDGYGLAFALLLLSPHRFFWLWDKVRWLLMNAMCMREANALIPTNVNPNNR